MATTLRLDDDVVEAPRRRAEREGRSMEQVARIAIRAYLERRGEDEAIASGDLADIPEIAARLARMATED